MEWDAQTVDQQENELISWRSLAGSEIENGGEVRFRQAPVGPATEVQVRLFYRPPGSSLGAAVAKLFGEEPSLQLDEDLYRFKQLAETGRIPTVDGQPVGGKQLEERNREREQNVRPVQPETREELRP
jgi:uncharacterized membrane protein